MPFASRFIDATKTGYSNSDVDSLAVAAKLAIGNVLTKRGWSYSRYTNDSEDTVGIIFNRRGLRDRDFDATTVAQWSQLEQRFAKAAVALGWSTDVVIEVKERTVSVAAVNPLLCRSCGCENDAVIGNCFVCGASRESEPLQSDSELRSLIAAVKTAVAALETYLEGR